MVRKEIYHPKGQAGRGGNGMRKGVLYDPETGRVRLIRGTRIPLVLREYS
jgi:hypothetical protein